jgi:transposase InsO family protein
MIGNESRPPQWDLGLLSEAVAGEVTALALLHPGLDCSQLRALLKRDGKRLLRHHIHWILTKHHLQTPHQRWLALEKRVREESLVLTGKQALFVEKHNPAFRERRQPPGGPGEVLLLDVLPFGSAPSGEAVYAYLVVDAFSAFSFVRLSSLPQIQTAIELLHAQVLSFYRGQQLAVGAVYGSVGPGLAGDYPLALYLDHQGVPYHPGSSKRALRNGFIQRMGRLLQEEFFCLSRQEPSRYSLNGLEDALQEWLTYYNYYRPCDGYPNYGLPPYTRLHAASAPR